MRFQNAKRTVSIQNVTAFRIAVDTIPSDFLLISVNPVSAPPMRVPTDANRLQKDALNCVKIN